MNLQQEIAHYNVSRETYAKLENFVELLKEWNGKMNLVSKNSLADVWERHVLDSLQLISYIPPEAENLVDIGSGAGFPALVLALVMQEKMPHAHWSLVESITKKTVYLKDVCARLNLQNVTVINKRVETADFAKVDVVTARAVAELDILCSYAFKIGNPHTKMLFLKGRTYNEEKIAADSHWSYNLQIHQNRYSTDGVIMELSNLRKQK